MNRKGNIIFIRNFKRIINSCVSCTPVFMCLNTCCTCLDLFFNHFSFRTNTFSEEAKVSRHIVYSLQHTSNVEFTWRTCCCITSVSRTSTTTKEGCDSIIQTEFRKVSRNIVYVKVNTTSSHNQAFCCNGFCTSTHNKIHIVHCIWITTTTDSNNLTITNTDIRFNDSCIVNDGCTCNNRVHNRWIFTCFRSTDTHTITQNFTTTELRLLSIYCEVFFNGCKKIGISKTYAISYSWSIVLSILFTIHFKTHLSALFLV